MRFGPRGPVFLLLLGAVLAACPLFAQSRQSSSSSGQHTKHRDARTSGSLDTGEVTHGVYRNKTLGLSIKIPDGWVLRTDEMNASPEGAASPSGPPAAASSAGAKVLLAAFSRPPEATGEDVNASMVIAAESAAAYPGLTEAAQYFEPLTEVAKAQGFQVDADPYEIEMGGRFVVRGDFHKNVSTRVMRQSTLAMLSHGHAISITVIAGTEDEIEELLDGLTFTADKHPRAK
jgi:hypothetical protein